VPEHGVGIKAASGQIDLVPGRYFELTVPLRRLNVDAGVAQPVAALNGSLDASVAEAYGLFRLYGPAGRQAGIRSALAGFSVKRSSATSPAPNSDGVPA